MVSQLRLHYFKNKKRYQKIFIIVLAIVIMWKLGIFLNDRRNCYLKTLKFNSRLTSKADLMSKSYQSKTPIFISFYKTYSDHICMHSISLYNEKRIHVDSSNCPVSFYVTDNQEEADAVIFDVLQGQVIPSIQERKKLRPWQKQVLFALESYSRTYELRNYKKIGYDLRMTYELDAEINLPYAFDYYDFIKPPVPTNEKRKDAIAVAFISNCKSITNNRTEIFKELMTMIPIHSYGECYRNKNPNIFKSSLDSKSSEIKYYKFSLSFENSNDIDYITEKYYQILESGSVPVFLGAPNFKEEFAVDQNGYISLADFPDLRSLANHLIYLSNHDEEYEKLLAWKKTGPSEQFKKITEITKVNEICRLAMYLDGKYTNQYKRP